MLLKLKVRSSIVLGLSWRFRRFVINSAFSSKLRIDQIKICGYDRNILLAMSTVKFKYLRILRL